MSDPIQKKPRKYFPAEFQPTDWPAIEAELKKLLETPIESVDDLLEFMERDSELQFIMDEETAWRYIHMTCHADDKDPEQAFNDYYANIIGKWRPYDFEIKKRFYNCPFRKELPPEQYDLLNRIISNDIELYREENIPLINQERELANKYGSMIGAMTVNYRGEEKTMQQLAVFQKNPDRTVREETFRLRFERLEKDSAEMDRLYDELRALRMKRAENAGFDNYRDFEHRSKGRFSYTPQDLYNFHDAVEKHVVPFVGELLKHRQSVLGIDAVRPWDTAVDLDGKVLKPFADSNELVDKGIRVLTKVDPAYGKQLERMKLAGLLDLDNRKGKAPGGYNYPLEEMKASFIFMNSVGLHDDMTTLMHEAGHAMHAAAVKDISLVHYKATPSEVAELASMAMELLTMDHWGIFYSDADDLKKARRDQLEGALTFLPWCMTVDALQQWVYTHPEHTADDRAAYFTSLMDRFFIGVDWSGLESWQKIRWMFQLHIFEVPFYYIEYGMSQLGALAIYRNYKQDPAMAIKKYDDFLKLGYSRPVRDLYETAGIGFDFSGEYIKGLVEFVREELKNL
jgi:oligoendopeptidase F